MDEKERETNLYKIGTAKTDELRFMQTDEVCCPLESLILAEETRFWAQAGSVEEYLEMFVEDVEISVNEPNKLYSQLYDRQD